ncbi:MAG: UDP-N-acetylmuramate--L-alanine ligase [Planctomycetaceae bacterium]
MLPASPFSSDGSKRTTPLRIRDAHLVGIGGSGMQGLAELLSGFRVRVTGSDQHIPPHLFWSMHRRGLRASQGHAASHLPQEADVLIYSPAVPHENPERREAERRGVPQLSLSEALGRIMANRSGVSVAGTHGKTSTTALLGHVLEAAGESPSVLTGGEILGRGVSGRAGSGPLFVVESCEYRGHFLNLTPRHMILTNLEADHFDCFGTLEESIDVFRQFAARLPADGTLLVNYDSPTALEAVQGTKARVQSFGSRAGADWWLGGLQPSGRGWRFQVFRRAKLFGVFDLPLPGRHNVLNSLAVVAMCHRLGVKRRMIAEGLRSFRGVRRRFEVLGSWRGMTLVDDYAHHPTAIRVTLRTAREAFPRRRIWCVFQPHQISRTRALFADFVRSLSRADRVLVSPVFAARESGSDDQSRLSVRMADRIRRLGTPAQFVDSLDRIISTIETEAAPGDVLLILGAGDVDRIGHDLLQRPQHQRAS